MPFAIHASREAAGSVRLPHKGHISIIVFPGSRFFVHALFLLILAHYVKCEF
jgi:hypothetical protein